MTGDASVAKDLLLHAKEMRKEPTISEAILWDNLRREKLDVRFRRQHLIGKYIVDFFHWLHLEKKKVHGDIKSSNIVVKYLNCDNPFKIIDYETITNQDLTRLCNELHRDNYYYYHLGCHYNKPYLSFRMDLQSFGQILHSIAASVDYYYTFDWQKRSSDYYHSKYHLRSRNDFNLLDNNKINYRKDHRIKNNKYKDIILKYFEIIENQGWEDEPNIKVYEQLKELFNKS
jgi:hypothetical protein